LQPAVNDTPILGGKNAFGNLLRHGEMVIMRACGELRQSNCHIADVRPTRKTRMWKFSQWGAAGKITFRNWCGVFGGVLRQSLMGAQRCYHENWQWCRGLWWHRRRWFQPSMSSEDSVDVFLAR